MNCQAIQNQILNLPDPRELTPALREHVRTCPACLAWARQAARLEALLGRLWVPPAPGEKKEEMLDSLMRAKPFTVPAAPPGLLRRNASYVAGLAAAVLVAVGVYALWPSKSPEVVKSVPTQKDPLLEKMVAGNTELARAGSAPRRLEVLRGMADAISGETRGMALIANGSDLRQMAGWYDKVVSEGMVPQAGKLPLDIPAVERAKLLDGLADRLRADATEAEMRLRDVPQDAQPAFQRIAATARQGEEKLRTAATAVRKGK